MPCGDRCKQIIDQAAAVHRAASCMTNTVLMKHAGDKGPTKDQADEFKARAESLAEMCAVIEASFSA